MSNIRRVAGCALVLAGGLLLAGCSNPPGPGKKDKDKAAAKHDHPEEGPHHGALAEWGEEKYHAEFTVDHKEKKATVYILDGAAKKAAPIAAETITLTISKPAPAASITLKADPQEGDPKGQASRFSGTHDRLVQETEFEGEISGKVGDAPYAGKFKEEGHDHQPPHKKDDKK